MKIKISTTFKALLFLGMSQTAFADHICDGDIISAIGEIESQYGGEEFTGKRAEYDADGLISKLNAAMSKLHYGKSLDAEQKVNDAQTKLDRLMSGKPRLTSNAYDDISDELGDVLDCLGPFLPVD